VDKKPHRVLSGLSKNTKTTSKYFLKSFYENQDIIFLLEQDLKQEWMTVVFGSLALTCLENQQSGPQYYDLAKQLFEDNK
jgi:hypothetical protein